jgi:hypothetical protein
LLGWVVTEAAVQVIGFSAIKIAAQRLFELIVADPVPVEPAVVLMDHPAPVVPLLSATFPYNSARVAGDVVEKEYIIWPSAVAANIRTAALAVTVVMAVTAEI